MGSGFQALSPVRRIMTRLDCVWFPGRPAPRNWLPLDRITSAPASMSSKGTRMLTCPRGCGFLGKCHAFPIFTLDLLTVGTVRTSHGRRTRNEMYLNHQNYYLRAFSVKTCRHRPNRLSH